MIDNFWAYVVLAVTITVIPGPTVVLTIKNSLRYGSRVALANIVGNFVAMIILSILSAVGLGAVLLSSAVLFSIVKVIGCFYLVYLGIKVWRVPTGIPFVASPDQKRCQRPVASVFKEGFTVGISNPKAIAFFTALFPQFIDPTRAYIPQFLVLILTIEGISCLVLMGYAFLSVVAAPYLLKQRSMVLFNRVIGSAFVGFGLALISDE